MHDVINSLLRDCRNNTPFAVCRNYRTENLMVMARDTIQNDLKHQINTVSGCKASRCIAVGKYWIYVAFKNL